MATQPPSVSSGQPPTLPPVPPKKKWRWHWRVLFILFVLIVGGAFGFGWWAIKTNQPGNFISRVFAARLPAHLHIGKTEFDGFESLILSDVQLMREPGAIPAVTVDRVIVTGALWKGEVENIRVENTHLFATIDAVQFLHETIKAELAIPPDGPPSFIHLDFTGGVSVNGKRAIDEAVVGVDATGPIIAVNGKALYDGKPVALNIATDGVGNAREYRMTLMEGVLPVWKSCDWLADLELLPRIPQEAREWIPEYADCAGSVVIANKEWEIFNGQAKAKWKTGRGDGKLYVDSKKVVIENAVVTDDELGTFNGQAHIDIVNDIARIRANQWTPGPRIPIPEIIPTTAILAVMPTADLVATSVSDGWKLGLTIADKEKNVQSTISWGPTWPLVVHGTNISLPLLQSFVPEIINLAAGNATDLHAVVMDEGLRNFSATIEQGRLIWTGWALGTINGKVDIRLPPDGSVTARVQLPSIGTMQVESKEGKGSLVVDVENAEALVVRLKGPEALPDLSGKIKLKSDFEMQDSVLRANVKQLTLNNVGITDVMRSFDTELSGVVSFYPQRIALHSVGRITSGDIRLPGNWHDLARRRPRFNAQIIISNGVVLAENILVRATDEKGSPLIDGFSAGLRGRFSAKEQNGTVIGVVDHADLEWLNTFMPIKAGLIKGECAVTFTADVDSKGVKTVDGYFLPLDADVQLPGVLSANGIKGSVQFRISRPTTPNPVE